MHLRITSSIIGSAMLALVTIAHAQAPFTAQLSWNLPTLNTDGSPIAADAPLTEIRVYTSTDPNSGIFASPEADHVTLPATATGWTYTQTGAVPGSIVYFRLRACNASACSGLSEQGSAQVPPVIIPPTPSAPTHLQVVIG